MQQLKRQGCDRSSVLWRALAQSLGQGRGGAVRKSGGHEVRTRTTEGCHVIQAAHGEHQQNP